MNCNNGIQRLILIAALVVGILIYALFTAAELAAATLLLPAVVVISVLGILFLLLSTSIGCECDRADSAFCCSGLLAALGGVGAVVAAIFSTIATSSAGTGYRIGVAISVGLLTLLLGGIVGYLAERSRCKSCGCSFNCGCQGEDDDDDSDCSQAQSARYYRR